MNKLIKNEQFLTLSIGSVTLLLSLLFDNNIIIAASKLRINFITTSVAKLTSWHFGILIFCLFLLPVIKNGRKIVSKKGIKAASLLIIAEILLFCISLGLKKFVSRARPYEKLPNITLIKDKTASFPSHHAAASFLWCFFMKTLFPKYNVIFLSFAICFSLTRVYTGVHYLSDLIGGFLIAYIVYLSIKEELSKLAKDTYS